MKRRLVAVSRWRAWAGIAGPAAFIAAWWTLGSIPDGYSPVNDPISQLAALDTVTRPVMTAGFFAFAAGVFAFAPVLRTQTSGGAARAAALTAAATLGIAALPLGGPGGDEPHALAAGVAYAALAATPLLAGRALLARGDRGAGAASIAAGMAVAVTLTASVVLPHGTGLAQRIGLTIGDVWIMASGVAALSPTETLRRGARRPSRNAGYGPDTSRPAS